MESALSLLIEKAIFENLAAPQVLGEPVLPIWP